ncbi:MAG: hypothetical protein HYY24_29545 [Verrucomicrobia bacterium]|nr:hypothetical protein [Verrucomicrobiota bacterium]
MKLKLKDHRLRSLEELWAIEDEFPAVCGPSPISYAARHGLTLSKRYLEYLDRQRANRNGARKTMSRRRKPAGA